MPGPFRAKSVSWMLFPRCPGFAEQPGTCATGLSARTEKVGGKKKCAFRHSLPALAGGLSLSGRQLITEGISRANMCFLVGCCDHAHFTLFSLEKISTVGFSFFFLQFLPFNTHFAPVSCQDDSLGQSRGEGWS